MGAALVRLILYAFRKPAGETFRDFARLVEVVRLPPPELDGRHIGMRRENGRR
jgi:hypothetical protein